ncbi:MAG TPA: hypothetical protein VGH85_13750 [Mycobacteriales bacterium]
MDVDAVADELYGMPPGEFTAARDRRVAEAREDGDRDTAKAITALRRPSTSAWLVNLLVRDDRDEARSFVELGRSLRQAQQQLAGEEMRALSQQRRKLVTGLTGRARRLGGAAGQQVSGEVSRQVEETLSAVLADDDAAELFVAGRLTTALRHTGMGPATAERPTTRREPAARTEPKAGKDTAKPTARERTAAEKAARAAREDARSAADAATERRQVADDLQATVETNLARVAELTEQLAEARAQTPRIQTELKQARRSADSAGRAADAAERRAADAQARLDALQSDM